MFVKDGIAYANSNETEIKIINVKIIGELSLLVTFVSGEEKIFDMSYLVKYPIYKNLENYDIFKTIKIENGVLTWDNGKIDISPEEVYKNSYEYEKLIAQ